MGITVRCKRTHHSLDLTASGFMRLRCRVATLSGEPFSSHYKELMHHRRSFNGVDPFYEEFDRKTDTMILKKQVSVKIVDFCLQPDCEGAIRYGACKKLLEVIGDYNNDSNYGYALRPVRFSEFVSLLRECVEQKCDLVWN